MSTANGIASAASVANPQLEEQRQSNNTEQDLHQTEESKSNQNPNARDLAKLPWLRPKKKMSVVENPTAQTWEDLEAVLAKQPIRRPPALSDVNPLVIVASYNDFGDLAHGPRGTEAIYTLRTYRLDVQDGSMTLLSVESGNKNPAFTRMHPARNVMYSCTESLSENGRVVSYYVNPTTGRMTKLGDVDAQGRSTCYLTIDKAQRFMLVVNYWSSQVVSMPINQETGALEKACSIYHPKGPAAAGADVMNVSHTKHVNHSLNDEAAQRERQKDPHTHAVVLEPFYGCVAYVPDLGTDTIHELHFNRDTGELTWLSDIRVGAAGRAHGPRYIEFHPTLPVCYVINEIGSEVAVFRVDREKLGRIAALQSGEDVVGQGFHSTLTPYHKIATIPEAFPKSLNTCGRIAIHPSGLYVIVSNRGHNSLAVFRVNPKQGGKLSLVGFFHTRGETPRHYQYDPTGQYLIVANQDSDSLAVFRFNLSDGKLKFTNNLYHCHSPNFVAFAMQDNPEDEENFEDIDSVAS